MKILSGLAGASLVLAASTASAGTLDISAYTGVNVAIKATITSPDVQGTFVAGSSTISDLQGLAPYDSTSSFISFCVDLQHSIAPPINDQNAALQLMSQWDGYGNFTPQDNAGNYAAYLYNTFASLVSTANERAGLQLALWNVLYDNDFVVGSGAFSASGSASAGARTLANEYLGNLALNLATAKTADAYWIRLYPAGGVPSDSPQDFIGPMVVTTPDGGATLALLGGALMALGVARRRFVR